MYSATIKGSRPPCLNRREHSVETSHYFYRDSTDICWHWTRACAESKQPLITTLPGISYGSWWDIIMAASGCVRPCFIVFNLLFWLMGLFLVGFMAWTMATNPALITGFISGSRYFTYSILGAGVLIVLAGLFGCIGGLKEGTCLLKTFIAFTIIILLIEIGGAVTAYMMQGQLQVYRDSGWTDFNTDTKNFLQTELKCCGFNSASEYGSTVANYPDSCFSDPSSKIVANQHNAVCWTKINEWLNSNLAIWAGTLAGVALVQIVSLILAIVMLSKVKKSRKVSSTSSNGQTWDGRHVGGRQAARRGGGRRY